MKIFGKARKRLIDTGKIGKYVLYAIGEILLVMIGILLALQVNNWNENYKDRKAETTALINLKNEFDENQLTLSNLIIKREEQENQCRRYLDLIADPKISIEKKIIAHQPNSNTKTWGASNSALSSLINSGGIDRIQNDSLKFLLTKWLTDVSRFNDVEEHFVIRAKEIEDFESEVIPRTFPKMGDHRQEWPGSQYSIGMKEKALEATKGLIEDVKYYNLFASWTTEIYIYLINAKGLAEDCEEISRLIIKELATRNVSIISG